MVCVRLPVGNNMTNASNADHAVFLDGLLLNTGVVCEAVMNPVREQPRKLRSYEVRQATLNAHVECARSRARPEKVHLSQGTVGLQVHGMHPRRKFLLDRGHTESQGNRRPCVHVERFVEYVLQYLNVLQIGLGNLCGLIELQQSHIDLERIFHPETV